jgi:hypothetical protein
MAKLIEMDERVPIFMQMEEDVGPVILINKFSVNPEEFDQFLKGWANEAEKFKEHPGFMDRLEVQNKKNWYMAHLLGLIEHEDMVNKLSELTERVYKLEKEQQAIVTRLEELE